MKNTSFNKKTETIKKIRITVSLLIVAVQIVTAQSNKFPTSGNVGIGTVNPLSTLHVNGGLRITGKSPNYAGPTLIFGASGNSSAENGNYNIEFIPNSGLNFSIPWPNSNFGNYDLFLSLNRRVGIGTGTPTEKLQVQGASSNVAIKINTGVANTSGARVSVASSAGSYKSVSANDFVLANINNNQGGILFNTQTGGVETN
ncbi:MAG: hypothetical protein LBP34_00250, partial [Flavobacteriaceae bacterium]|nr:hypothetical protein [Flavobacteriaceae bacterium]